MTAGELRYYFKVGDEPTLSDLLHEFDIGRIYGPGRLLEKTVILNPNIKPSRGNRIFRGERIYVPLDDPQKLPASFRILESGEIVRTSPKETPPQVVQKTPEPMPKPSSKPPAPVVAAPIKPVETRPEPKPTAEVRGETKRKYWLQVGYGQRTSTEKIGNVKTIMQGLSVLPEAAAGIHFNLDERWFSGLSTAVSNPLTFLNVDMPLLYSFELYGGRERVAQLGERTAWSPAAIVRYGLDAHITPNASSGTASTVSYLDRETRSWEIGVRNCLRFTESADGTSFCLDITRILSKAPQEQTNRLTLTTLSGWGLEGMLLYPLNSAKTLQAIFEGKYSTASEGTNSVRSFGGVLGMRFNFFD